MRKALLPLCVALALASARGQSAKPAQPANTLLLRVGDTGFVGVRAESFRALSPQQQALAYWLTQASIAIDPITPLFYIADVASRM